MTTAFEMISAPAALRTLVDRLQEEAVLAFDTEFTWERTYYARLGLVQIAAADGRCVLVDPLAAGDLAPLGELLANARIVKILHDAPQDLMILRRATGVAARNVFDTRLAAGFAGLASTLSLANLLAETVDVHLAKAHTRADWLARPLAPEELDYAADDVRYLPEVAARLRARARTAGVEAWLDEEGYCYVSARGFDDGRSHEEPSFAVLGIELDDALGLAREFGQAAIFWWDGAVGRVVFTE